MSDADVLFPWEKDGGEDAQDYAPEADVVEERTGSDVDAGAEQSGGSAHASDAAPSYGDASPADQDAQVQQPAEKVAAPVNDTDSTDAVSAGSPDAEAAETSREEPSPDAADAEAGDDESRFEVLDTEYARRAAERAGAALRENPIAQKEYYSISEVCELVGLKPHVLRYWETQFQVLNPSKNRSGNRVYQRKEIRLITLVKHLLYEEKYTVEGAKAKLDQLRRGGELAETAGAVLDRAMIEQLRADLSELNSLLTPPART